MRADLGIAVSQSAEVYRPSEDSYLLLGAVSVAEGERFLEVGTGTGLVALHAAKAAAAVATDVNPAAVALARENALHNGIRLDVVLTDLMAGLRGPFDVVAFNPPYLEGGPLSPLERAWQGGEAGSEVAVRFLKDLRRVLAPRGRAYLLLSATNAPAMGFARSAFATRVVASKRLFFERLDVLEIRVRPPNERRTARGRHGD